MDHLSGLRSRGESAAEIERVWVNGMAQINQRAAQFGGSVTNEFFGTVSGQWRVYVGRPAVAGGDTFALAINTQTGAIATGLRSGIRPLGNGELGLFNFTIR